MRDGHASRSLGAWLAPLSRDCGLSLDDLLDREERERAAQFRLAGDRARLVVGAVLSRLVDRRSTGIRPDHVALDRRCGRCGQPHGKPTTNGVGLSVSHGEGLVLVAVSPVPVGIDIEEIVDGAKVGELLNVALTDGERR